MELLQKYAEEHSEIDEYIEPYHPDVIYGINEKLKLDKGSHMEKEEYEYLSQMYKKNDLCLYVKNPTIIAIIIPTTMIKSNGLIFFKNSNFSIKFSPIISLLHQEVPLL